MALNGRLHFSKLSLNSTFSKFFDWVWKEKADENKGHEYLQNCCRVALVAIREFRRNQIPLRATALTFTVILALVPLLALGTSVLKGLGASDQMRQGAHVLVSLLETSDVAYHDSSSHSSVGPLLSADQVRQWPSSSLSGHLHRVADTIFDYVDKTKLSTMGWAGVLALLFTVYTLLGSIERTFNIIWQTDGNRTLDRKLVDYLALLVLLPLTVNFGVAAMVALKSPSLLGRIQQFFPWLDLQVLNLLPLLLMVASFSFLYGFLPNTKVSRSAALTGGVVGGLVWLLLQAVYFKLQIVVVRYNAIYGSFAALPLFMLWVYLCWLVFLLGAEISFGVQIRHRYLWRQPPLTPSGRMALAFEILIAATENFQRKQMTTRDSLVLSLKQPDMYIKELLDLLHRAGLIRCVPDEGYLPAAPLVELSPVEICQMVLGDLPQAIPADNPASLVLAAMRDGLKGYRLAVRGSGNRS